MHILVVFTGGTIGSSVSEGCITPDAHKGYRLLELYKGKCSKEALSEPCDFTVVEPVKILSENMNCAIAAQLVTEVKRQLCEKEYDGVVICHGTDTLQYTAAMFGYCFGTGSIPIVFVSSNYVLEDTRANGLINFAAAVSFISRRAGQGVFIAYQNQSDRPRIHRAARALPHLPYSDDVVSIMGQHYGSFTGNIFGIHTYAPNADYEEKEDEVPLLTTESIHDWYSGIVEIYPATGATYPDLTAYPDSVKAILHHTYHSGTICADTPGLKEFAEQAYALGIPIFLTGREPGICYESMKVFEKYGIRALPKASPIAMYVKLSLCVSTGKDPDEIMYASLGGDMCESKN